MAIRKEIGVFIEKNCRSGGTHLLFSLEKQIIIAIIYNDIYNGTV